MLGSIGHDSVFVQCMSDREEARAGGSAMVHDSHTHNGRAGGAATGRRCSKYLRVCGGGEDGDDWGGQVWTTTARQTGKW